MKKNTLEKFTYSKKKLMVKKSKDNLKQDIDIVVLISKDRAFDFLKEAKKYGFSYQERRSWRDIKTLDLMLKRQKLPY